MTEHQYRHALRALDSFMGDDPAPGTHMGDALVALACLCEEYEKAHFPLLNEDARDTLRRLERDIRDD